MVTSATSSNRSPAEKETLLRGGRPPATRAAKGHRLPPDLVRVDGRISARTRWLLGAGSFVALLIVWILATLPGAVPPIYLPSPLSVIERLFVQAGSGQLWEDVGISTFRILTAFLISAVMAIPIGLIMGRVRLADAALTPLVEFARYLPVVAFVPLSIIWAGTDETQKFLVIWIGTFFALTLMVIDNARSVARDFVDYGRTLGMSEGRILRKIVLRGAMPGILDSLRIALGWCWTWLLLGELVAASSGLGFRITMAQRYLETDLIFAYILVLGLMGLASDQLLRLLHRNLFAYLRKHEQ
ncbi:ABC transporter permease [Microbacterium enclense]|uniref:ABC transporter permease n=1 Tax=Microbacterium enclense TaxID=993073 RepID=UPI0021A2BEA9|nr:ABC transporter permease [Microbacterium enclense]MCT2085161.1 ABC transporter permease [Microbacterium enclense]